MNKKILELASKSDWYVEKGKIYQNRDYYPVTEGMDKFAKLIIQECVEQIIAKGTDWLDFAPNQTGVRPEYWDMAQQIKEHFGVE